tara:strand:- start:3196 stop:3588 length:393 start_codon:yes stop_codon:yes gene_type:complete
MSAAAKTRESVSKAVPLHRFESRPKVITLCGSTRFWDEFQRLNAELTLQGNLVFSVAVTSTQAGGELDPSQKAILDSVHFHKIRMSDEILVINPGGYIGESTAREIRYATEIGRKIDYLERPADGPLFEN